MKQNDVTDLIQLSKLLQSEVISTVRVLGDKHLTVGFAESCTGGLLSSFFTELAGVSNVFTGSIVSYDNKVKTKFLKVSEEILKSKGAVSAETVRQMAEEAQRVLDVSVAVSITGIAGPGGGSPEKPVGKVFVSVAGLKSETKVFEHQFDGNRKSIQLQSCLKAVKHLNEFINK